MMPIVSMKSSTFGAWLLDWAKSIGVALKLIRKHGYAYDDEEHAVALVAGPIQEQAAEILRLVSGVVGDELATAIERARGLLYAEREKRVHPGRDEKILASWNAL